MNITDNQMEMISVDKFKMGKKWFWVGVAIVILSAIAGLVYGITLVFEKNHRREGIIIIAFAVAWALLNYFIIVPWLADLMAAKGSLPGLNIR